jgi:predicted MFS family arabinose efflux permease
MEDNKEQERLGNDEDQYIGNIWGWKLSFVSLGIIVAMLLLMGIRYLTMNKTVIPSSQQTTIEQDSLLNNTAPKD